MALDGIRQKNNRSKAVNFYSVVRTERLELSHLSAPEPKSGASTNFATSALLREGEIIRKMSRFANQIVSVYRLAWKFAETGYIVG